jgi:hypothetical protein
MQLMASRPLLILAPVDPIHGRCTKGIGLADLHEDFVIHYFDRVGLDWLACRQ